MSLSEWLVVSILMGIPVTIFAGIELMGRRRRMLEMARATRRKSRSDYR